MVVRLLLRPGRIRRAEAEMTLAYRGVVEANQPMVGVSTPNVVAYALTIRCQDGNVVKRAGERWPRDVRGGKYQVIP